MTDKCSQEKGQLCFHLVRQQGTLYFTSTSIDPLPSMGQHSKMSKSDDFKKLRGTMKQNIIKEHGLCNIQATAGPGSTVSVFELWPCC